MPTVGAAVSAELKNCIEAAARRRSVTASRLVASLIEEFLLEEGQGISTEAKSEAPHSTEILAARGGAKTEQVFVRMDPYYFAELDRMAKERNWYRCTYLGNLFKAHADRRPILCNSEINALRQIARQLADMGRNINQIAKKLNGSQDATHQALSLEFDLVRTLIDRESKAVKELIRANLRGWGVQDVEA